MNIVDHSFQVPKQEPMTKSNSEGIETEFTHDSNKRNIESDLSAGTSDFILENREKMEDAFKKTMKQASLRIPPNAITLVQNFNHSSEGTEIPTMNDPDSIEWIYPSAETTPSLLIGQKALDVVVSECTSTDFYFELIWPFCMRTWQFSPSTPFTSIMSWRQNVAALFSHAIEQCGYVPSQTHVALVVPDVFEPLFIETLLNVLFEDLEVNQVFIGQEGLMTCFGAGLSTACVVDLGATCSSVALIEQGELIAAQYGLYGGDQMTIEFARRLNENAFPVPLNLQLPWDWHLAESLKEKWCTVNESELGIQVYDVHHRVPNQVTKKYQVKVYNEVYMAPLSFFYPGVFPLEASLHHFSRFIPKKPNFSFDLPFSSILNLNVHHLLSTLGTTPFPILVPALDQLISQLILDQASKSEERLKKFTGSILMVGGASRILLKLVESKLKPRFPSVVVTPPPRDMNPGHVAWKGLCVATRLESMKEYWIRVGEWRGYGPQGCWNLKPILTFLEPSLPQPPPPPTSSSTPSAELNTTPPANDTIPLTTTIESTQDVTME